MDIVQESRKYALSEIEKFESNTTILFEIAEEKAIELSTRLSADERIIRVGIALMDLKLAQAVKESRSPEHVAMSVEAAKVFLQRFDISESDKEKIINCIQAHHKDVPFTCIEAEICANADCYKFIHPKGFFAFIHLLGKRDSDFNNCLKIAEEKLEEKHDILSLDICRKELESHYVALKKMIAVAKLRY